MAIVLHGAVQLDTAFPYLVQKEDFVPTSLTLSFFFSCIRNLLNSMQGAKKMALKIIVPETQDFAHTFFLDTYFQTMSSRKKCVYFKKDDEGIVADIQVCAHSFLVGCKTDSNHHFHPCHLEKSVYF